VQLLEIDPAAWSEHGNRSPFAVRHHLVDEPLLQHDAVVALASQLPETDVEMNVRELPNVFDSDDVPDLDRPPAEIAAGIEDLGRWMALSYIEQVPAYRDLVDRVLASVPATPDTSPVTRREGYIFLSASNSVTPAHVDHEHNFLLQVAGTKKITIGSFDGALEEQRALEGMHSGHYGRVASLPPGMQTFVMQPGDGVYIPPRAVHMIENQGSTSISLSLVFHTPDLVRAMSVYAFNAKLRKLGLTPRPPGESPAVDQTKTAAVASWRVLNGMRRRLTARS
jgi:hypothetical protein